MSAESYTPRATTVAGIAELMAPMITREGVEQGLGFQPRASDVIISPFGKCGTTWLQQIVHGLRTGGDMDFDDISRVVPWIETAANLGLDLDAEQRGEPRAFKSHLDYDRIPRGCRYIVSVRDPKDAVVSLYHFFENWFFEAGSIDIATFARERYMPGGKANPEGSDYWTHFASWWPQRDNPQVLLLAYENMLEDPAMTITRIADFLDIPLSSDLLAIVLEQSSIGFMLSHKDRFDDLMMRRRSQEASGLPPGDSAKVRSGRMGSHKAELPADIVAAFDDMWSRTIEQRFELPSYQAAREQL